MTERYYGQGMDITDGASDRAQAIDLGMTWVGTSMRRASPSVSRWLKVEQELIDLHARYERACVED